MNPNQVITMLPQIDQFKLEKLKENISLITDLAEKLVYLSEKNTNK